MRRSNKARRIEIGRYIEFRKATEKIRCFLFFGNKAQFKKKVLDLLTFTLQHHTQS